MMDPRADSVEWLRNHIAVHDPEEGRWVPIGVLLPLMSREPWPAEMPWSEPSWDPLVCHLDVEAGNYMVEATIRRQIGNHWVVALQLDFDWLGCLQVRATAWLADSPESALDEIVAWVERLHNDVWS